MRASCAWRARFAGFDGEDRFPMLDVQVIQADRMLVDFRLVEVLLPRGPIGAAPRDQRRRFLRDRLPVPGIALSAFDGTTSQLSAQVLRQSDWLPGNVAAIYGVPPEQRADLVTIVAQRTCGPTRFCASGHRGHRARRRTGGGAPRCACTRWR